MTEIDCMEAWKPVVGFEGWYSVSNMGRVRRDKREKRTYPGRLLTQHPNNSGYLQVHLSKDGDNMRRVHRLVAEAFVGQCPMDREVNHCDGNKINNVASNLEYVTRSENINHSLRMNGPRRRRSKLTTEEKAQIFDFHSKKSRTYKEMAEFFGISICCVWRTLKLGGAVFRK